MTPHLISHPLCPYVQRVAIALAEKGVPFERTTIDLADKPDWFLKISPLGKTPVLVVGQTAIFESAVILEFLEETQPNPLHPAAALERARHRSWIEFASSILNDIAGFYSAGTDAALADRTAVLTRKFLTVEAELGDGPYFAGSGPCLVDVAFAPVFRYFDAFDRIGDFGILSAAPRTRAWRRRLAGLASVRGAVDPDFGDRLLRFLRMRGSRLSDIMSGRTGGGGARVAVGMAGGTAAGA